MAEIRDSIKTADYTDLLKNIKKRITQAQYAALKAVNKELIGLYWDTGRMIVEKQRGRTWGQEVVQRIAKDLQSTFPGIKGFSASNLWRMKLFHKTYASNIKLAPMVREIAWSRNLIVMERCKDDLFPEQTD